MEKMEWRYGKHKVNHRNKCVCHKCSVFAYIFIYRNHTVKYISNNRQAEENMQSKLMT